MLNHPCTVAILFSLRFSFAVKKQFANKTQRKTEIATDSSQHQHAVKLPLKIERSSPHWVKLKKHFSPEMHKMLPQIRNYF